MNIINNWKNSPRNIRIKSRKNSNYSKSSKKSVSSSISEITDKISLVNKQNVENLIEESNYNEDTNLSRILEFEKGIPSSFYFINNKIFTIPFTFKGYISFVGKKLSDTPFNICLIFICLYYLISFLFDMDNLSDLNLFYSISFHLFIFLGEILFTTIEYISIYINDNKVNNQIALIYNYEKKKFEKSTWKEIKVGHIIKVKKNEVVPADIILLESSDNKHQCYLDNSSINGNYDMFKIKKACNDTQLPDVQVMKMSEYVKNIKGVLKYEEPNSNMNSFKGRLKLENYPRASDITQENFVVRGSIIKNVECIYGLVVYTGMETKIMMTLKYTEIHEKNGEYSEFTFGNTNQVKKNQFDRVIIKKDNEFIRQSLKKTQYWIIIIYILILIVFLLMGIHKGIYLYLSKNEYALHYLGYPYEGNTNDNPLYEIFLGFTRAVLTFHFFMPFNWFGLIKISYYILARFVEWDEEIKRTTDEKVEIKNPKSLANFAQVRHIVADKTGTLTKRKYEVKLCSIHGKLFSFQIDDIINDRYIFSTKEDYINDLKITKEVENKTVFAPLIEEFFESLSICHSVKATPPSQHIKSFKHLKSTNSLFDNYTIKNDENEFASAYCEEVATFKILKKFGYRLYKSEINFIQLKVNNKMKKYNIIGHNKYHESRKKMSVVISKTDKKTSVLLCKAYDISAFDLINLEEQFEPEIKNSKNQIEQLTKLGFHYFILFKRELNEEETSNFITVYKSAQNYIVKSEEHLNKLAIEYETNLTFLGIIFFEEIIEPDLKYSISLLRKTGIKIWIASGDKKENVLSIGQALDLYNPNSICADFNDKDKPEDLDIKMSKLLIQFLFPNHKIEKMEIPIREIEEDNLRKSNSQDLSIIISGNCFSRICKDQRNYQSLATLLSFCTYLCAYKFSPNNKLVLCQMIKNYCAKNSRLLAIGDGFNDFSMLREADLSIGIFTKEILQVRNTCDALVSNFSQIVDLILVHGTWNYKKILKIALLSFYLHFLLLIPKLLYLNENFHGFSFYDQFNLIFTLNILVLNLFILFMFTFDVPVERALITLNINIYRDNIYDDDKMIITFGVQALKSLVDSGIIYVLNKRAAQNSINLNGNNVDISLFGNQILYVSYALFIIKVLTLNLKFVNHLHLFITFITVLCLIGITFISPYYQDSVLYGITHLNIILSNILAIFCCCLYEVLARYILFLLNYDFLSKLTLIFKDNISKLLFVKNFKKLVDKISEAKPRILNELDKISFTEVLNRIYTINKQLDPALENMADVSNDEASNLRIRKPLLNFFDQKVEIDYVEYCNMKVTVPYIIYLFSLALFLGIDIILRGYDKQKVVKMIYIFVGLLLLIPKLKEKFSRIFPFYFALILTIELIFIYTNKINNDIKICLQISLLINFPLFYCPSNKIITIIILLYLVGITPSLFLNDYGMNSINKIYEENFLYKNLCLVYIRQMSIYGVVILLFISSHYTQLGNRIEFLKYHKTKLELKKDELILSNLIPKFIRAKMQEKYKGKIEITIVFCDISNFDYLVAKLSPKEIIIYLDQFYSYLDRLCEIYGLQKIETVGKTYMAAGGIKECEKDIDKTIRERHHSVRCFEFAKDILVLAEKMIFNTGDRMHVKIGINKGSVIPAVLGTIKPQFSLIGDAVNFTSRMCSNADIDSIACSVLAYEEIKNIYKNNFYSTIKDIKGKGNSNIYLFSLSQKINLNLEKRKSAISKEQLKKLISKSVKNISSLKNVHKYEKENIQLSQILIF